MVTLDLVLSKTEYSNLGVPTTMRERVTIFTCNESLQMLLASGYIIENAKINEGYNELIKEYLREKGAV